MAITPPPLAVANHARISGGNAIKGSLGSGRIVIYRAGSVAISVTRNTSPRILAFGIPD